MLSKAALARRHLAAVLLIGALALLASACGSSSSGSSSAAGNAGAQAPNATTSGQITHPKTKFALHAGLAFGAFHRWIYKPLKSGELRHPLEHKLAVIKAGLAATFVYHELKLALADAQADPTLSKLVAPVTALEDRFKGLPAAVKSGGASGDSAGGLNGAISSVKSQAAGAGSPIAEQAPATPAG